MFCPKCGESNQNEARNCARCGYPLPVVTTGSDGLTGILPTHTNGWAIAAGYLGLFSLLALPGPFAAACGIIALKKLRLNPDQRGHVRAWIGIVLGSLGSLGLVIGIISMIAGSFH